MEQQGAIDRLPEIVDLFPVYTDAAALNEVTGCTPGSNSIDRLLNERRRELQREEAFLHDRAKERTRG